MNRTNESFALNKPRVRLISTGGTIAGLLKGAGQLSYHSAQLDAQAILQTVPDLSMQASWSFSQPFNMASQNLNWNHWRLLHQEICHALGDSTCDFILVTHGTDTIEETLFWLHLCLPAKLLQSKPLLFVAAMHPADHPESDGCANLLVAFELGCAMLGQGRPLFGLIMHNEFVLACYVQKHHKTALNAFHSGKAIAVTTILDGHVDFEMSHEFEQGVFSHLLDQVVLPCKTRIELLYCSPTIDEAKPVDQLPSDCSCLGFVVAAPGNGAIPDIHLNFLETALKRGATVVRASRVHNGEVTRHGEFTKFEQFRAKKKLPAWQGNFFDSSYLSIPQALVLARWVVIARSSMATTTPVFKAFN